MNAYRKGVTIGVALSLGLSLAGCSGGAGPETAALSSAPLPRAHARLKIHRESSVIGMATDARVKIDGREVASLGNDETKTLDIPFGNHQITIDHWSHPGVSKLTLHAKPGMIYELEATVRGDAAAAGLLFGLAGSAIESASNGDAGFWAIQVKRERPAA